MKRVYIFEFPKQINKVIFHNYCQLRLSDAEKNALLVQVCIEPTEIVSHSGNHICIAGITGNQ